jgi:glutamate-ammonia-ligase adenylyltransferase
MPKLQRELALLSARIDAMRAAELRQHLAAAGDPLGAEVGVLLGTAFPALGTLLRGRPEDATAIAREGWRTPRSRAGLADAWRRSCEPDQDVGRALRRFARRERMRVALREVLPRALGGADIDVTSRELAHLADATVEVALGEATRFCRARFGEPVAAGGGPSTFVVLGMGKLGGEELNAGSDVDLAYFYDTDDGAVRGEGGLTLHEFWLRVARRLTATLDEVTEDGFVWRVDLRLRPEGASGPLVCSLAAAERYYESFGRLWERAALLRARAVAGDLDLGERLLASLEPFVWRRRIDPSIATELVGLVRRARAELSSDAARDLKLGPGGIREAEFFVQTLQLVWGGRDPSLRVRPTLAALARLEAKGLCTAREASDVADGYIALRRAEHAIQNASGVQTHSLPSGKELLRVARVLGFATEDAFVSDLARRRRRVEERFVSILPSDAAEQGVRHAVVLGAIERADAAALAQALAQRIEGEERAPDEVAAFGQNLLELGKHPDSVLGVRTREAFPGLADTLLDALFEAADPMQAARYLRFFFARVRQPAVYVRLVFADPAALRRLVSVLGASAFVGDALCNNPELGDLVLFSRQPPTRDAIYAEIAGAHDARPASDEDPEEALVGALRLAKTRLTLEVALADLAGAFGVREVNQALTEVADASLEVATEASLGGDSRGLAVIAMGKLGGREISYGSDLDVLFVYDAGSARPGGGDQDALSYFTKAARRVIRLISTFHGAGPGYELDTRLRPSGNQGLLVTSLDAFARYHGAGGAEPGTRAAVWERMALTRARFAAGDEVLGQRAVAIARAAAYAEPPGRDQIAEMRRIRARVEREASGERPGVHDLKLGRGALLDIEFIVQLLQISQGPAAPLFVRPSETPQAIEGLRLAGALSGEHAATLSEAYAFLRRLELKVRIVRVDGAHLFDERSHAMGPLARRMGMRDHPQRSAAQALVDAYVETTSRVRAVFDEVFGATS